jgi:tyrosyl-tRNA synthetase
MSEILALRQSISEGRNPRDVKVLLAQELVARFHGAAAAVAALEDFQTRFQRNAIPDDIPEISLAGEGGIGVVAVLKQAGLTASTSEAIRMIDQGGVRLDGDKLTDRGLMLKPGAVVVLQVGKRKFARVTLL